PRRGAGRCFVPGHSTPQPRPLARLAWPGSAPRLIDNSISRREQRQNSAARLCREAVRNGRVGESRGDPMKASLFAGVSAIALIAGLGVAHAQTDAVAEAQDAARAADIFQASQTQTPIQLAQNAPQQTGAPTVVAQAMEPPETVLIFGRAEQQIGI